METPNINFNLLLQSLVKGTNSFPAGKVLRDWLNDALNEQGFEIVNNEIVEQKKDCEIKAGNWYVCKRTFTANDGIVFEEGKEYLSEEDSHLTNDSYSIKECKSIDVSLFVDNFYQVHVYDDNKQFLPKFVFGDCIIGPDSVPYMVVDFGESYRNWNKRFYYKLTSISSDRKDVCHYDNYVESNFHLWSISDAKTGDFIVDSDGNVGIMKDVCEDGWHSLVFYNSLYSGNKLYGLEHCSLHSSKDAHPASQEQINGLLDALCSNGYSYDFVNKKLVKIEHNSFDGSKSSCINEDNLCKIKAGNWYTCIKSVLYTGTPELMFEVGKKYLSEEDGHLVGNCYLIRDTKSIDVTSFCDCFSLVKETDKPEPPKFQPGDWIFRKEEPYIVVEVCDADNANLKPYYVLENTNGTKLTHYAKYVDSEFRRWTIYDANRGDVLMDMYGNIGIFDKISNIKWYSFVYYNPMKEYGLSLGGRAHYMTNVVPAVFNQKMMLLDKLRSNGYAFDFANKKIVKIDSNEQSDFANSEIGCSCESKNIEEHDAVDQKFHPGDCIVGLDGDAYFVEDVIKKDVSKSKYLLKSQHDECCNHKQYVAYVDCNFHKWTINDAKPGDVLIDGSGVIGFFESLIDINKWHSCVYLSSDEKMLDLKCNGTHNVVDTVPASFERKDAFCDIIHKKYDLFEKQKIVFDSIEKIKTIYNSDENGKV